MKEGQTQEPVGGMKSISEIFEKHIHVWTNNDGQNFIAPREVERNNLPEAIKYAMQEYAKQFTPPPAPEGETKQNISIEFAEWIPSSGFTQIAKRLGGYWFKSKDSKKYTTQDVFFEFLIDSGNVSSCDVYGHDVIPILGEENSIIGECCRVCGAKIDESNTPPPSPVGIDVDALAKAFLIPEYFVEFPTIEQEVNEYNSLLKAFKAGYAASLPQSSTGGLPKLDQPILDEDDVKGIIYSESSTEGIHGGDYLDKEDFLKFASLPSSSVTGEEVEEINKIADVAIEYCDKYLAKGVVYFNSFKQSFVTIKHLTASLPVTGESEAIGERKFTLKEVLDIHKSGMLQGICSPEEANNKPDEIQRNYFKNKFGIDI